MAQLRQPETPKVEFFEGWPEETGTTPTRKVYEEFKYRWFENVCVQVGNWDFFVHSYYLETFHEIIKHFPIPIPARMVVKLRGSVDDIRNTFRVLYSRDQPVESRNFDTGTWKSALWAAREFDNPTLQSHSIRGLEQKTILAEEYLMYSRQFDIPEWTDIAVNKLVDRPAPLNLQVARDLGVDLVVQLHNRKVQKLCEKIEELTKDQGRAR
ncbi:hypothetical protein FRC12_021018 [Ceratobasidium sp. 428]|nr:hypothetical protein FRC12_021018 [Ceratobasidium sp. 428]